MHHIVAFFTHQAQYKGTNQYTSEQVTQRRTQSQALGQGHGHHGGDEI
jgi:hypothetical protein